MIIALIFVVVIPIVQMSTSAHASKSYQVIFSKQQTFPFFDFAAINLNNPTNVSFTMKNATRLWFSYKVTSSHGITIYPGYATSDPRYTIATRMDKVGSLFPPNTSPLFDVSENSFLYAERLYTTSFSAPNQQITITATPFTNYAMTMTASGAIFALANVDVKQVIQDIFNKNNFSGFLDGIAQIQHLRAFNADFRSLVSKVQKGQATINDAQKCVVDLYDLFNDAKDVKALQNVFTKVIGAGAINIFSRLQKAFDTLNKIAALAGTLLDYASVYLNENGKTPSMTLRSVSNVCGSIHSSNVHTAIPTCGVSPTPIASQGPIVTPTDTPEPTPTNIPTSTPGPPTPTPSPTYGLLINGQVSDTVILPSNPRPGGGTPICDISVLQGIVLTNSGSVSEDWVTNFLPPGQDEIGYSPLSGTLAAGASVPLNFSAPIIIVSRPSETIQFITPGAYDATLEVAGFCEYP